MSSASAIAGICEQIFDYSAQPQDLKTTCNLCDKPSCQSEATTERYGYSIWKCTCSCGLVTINPRMTKEAYAKFYQGPYRALVSAFHGREINAQTIQPEQREYAQSIGDFLKPYLDKFVAHNLLDIGGSTGVVAAALGSRFKMSGIVLDPCEEELKEASKAGLTTVLGTMEDFEPNGKWDLILLCQSVDHLLDISGTLTKINACLSTNGLFFVDIVDYNVTKQLKIDHPFNLTPETMRKYLEKTGFEALIEVRADDGVHVRYVCEAK